MGEVEQVVHMQAYWRRATGEVKIEQVKKKWWKKKWKGHAPWQYPKHEQTSVRFVQLPHLNGSEQSVKGSEQSVKEGSEKAVKGSEKAVKEGSEE